MLVIEGKSRESILQEERAKWEEMTVQEHMDYYMNQGIDKKEAMKKVAKDRGLAREIFTKNCCKAFVNLYTFLKNLCSTRS